MSILYTMILKNLKTVLCEYTEFSGNFQQISLRLLKNIDTDENFICFPYESFYFFFFKCQNPKISIMCISDFDSLQHELIYDFLNQISDLFLASLSDDMIDEASAYSFKDFVEVLKREKKNFRIKNKRSSKSMRSSIDSGFTYYDGK